MERTEALFHIETRQWLRFVDLCRESDERLLGSLRLLVAAALAEARSWEEAQLRLGARGLRYHPRDGGLLIVDTSTGEVLCQASEVGPAYLELVRRFGTGFPGHPRPGLAAMALCRVGIS